MLWNRTREPVNALTHFIGLIGALVVFGVMLAVAFGSGSARHIIALAIFGVSLILLYTASTLFHALPVGPMGIARLQRFDQMMVYVLIAGTYTPICMIALPDVGGWPLLAVIWASAAAGITLNILVAHVTEWVSIALCLIMGCLALFTLPVIVAGVPAEGIVWLSVGGIAYAGGALIMGFNRPHLIRGVFEAHALWHLCVMGGSACHIWAILHIIAPIK